MSVGGQMTLLPGHVHTNRCCTSAPLTFSATRSAWIDQWSQVLTSYQDEVWGELDSLVREARDEVRKLGEVEQSAPAPEPKALIRLRAILGHLRGT